MKTLAKRLVRLEERLAPAQPDFARNPRQRHRLVITGVDRRASLETSTCRRTLAASGCLSEIVRLDGGLDGLTDAALDEFVSRFPVERI
jgi:hypothetical protein